MHRAIPSQPQSSFCSREVSNIGLACCKDYNQIMYLQHFEPIEKTWFSNMWFKYYVEKTGWFIKTKITNGLWILPHGYTLATIVKTCWNLNGDGCVILIDYSPLGFIVEFHIGAACSFCRRSFSFSFFFTYKNISMNKWLLEVLPRLELHSSKPIDFHGFRSLQLCLGLH